MAWYYGTYACGHEGRTNIVGPTKNRQWVSDRHFEKLCSECWEIKKAEDREKANAEAAAKAREMELPELQGTEKQVAWANTLRQTFIDTCEKKIDYFKSRLNDNPEWTDLLNECSEILNYIITQKVTASWYIDNRDTRLEDVFEKAQGELKKMAAESTPEAKAAIDEAIAYPEKTITGNIAEIGLMDKKIQTTFEKNERFIDIVKELGYHWELGAWEKKIGLMSGTAQDRMAELGNKLLNAGIPIRIIDAEARQKAVDGTYTPEHKRWIARRVTGEYGDWLSISWPGKDDNLYNAARRLTRSRWSNPNVVVKPEYFQEIEDFAELFDFHFSPGASELIQKAKAAKKAQTVKPKQVSEQPQKDGLKDILNSGSEIIDDLKD